MAAPRKQLREFLADAFASSGQLDRFVGDYFEELHAYVAWDGTDRDQQAGELIEALEERGRMPELWPALVAERESRTDEIRAIESVFTARPDATEGVAHGAVRGGARRRVPMVAWGAVGVAVVALVLGAIALTRSTTTTTTTVAVTPATQPTTTTTTTAAPVATPRTAPLGGVFNIAVATFEAEPADDAATAREAAVAADDLVGFLATELEAGGALFRDVAVGLYERPEASGDLASDLETLADDSNANIVVTATLELGADGSTVTPTFYVPRGQLGEAEELTGEYALGMPAQFDAGFDSPAVKELLRRNLQRRSCLLAQYVAGLSLYQERLYNQAARSFSAAADGTACPDTLGDSDQPGAELAHYFLGKIASLSGDLDTAASRYATALGLNPSFTRARFGQAEVAFQQFRESCTAEDHGGADIAGLDASLDQFERAFGDYSAMVDSGRQPVPFLETTAYLSMGRVQLCLSQAGQPRWEATTGSFSRVIEQHRFATGSDKARVSDFASEAYAGLGFVALLEDPNDPLAETAIDSFSRAIDLGPNDDRLAVFLAMRAAAHALAGNGDLARADCDAALVADLSIAPCEGLDLEVLLSPLALYAFVVESSTPFLGEFLTELPMTGIELWVLAALGLLLTALGLAMVRVAGSHRRR